MRVLCAAAFIALLTGALLTGAAYAQMPNINLIPEMKSQTPEEIEADKVRDKAYQDSLRKIPDAKTSADPWGAVRSDTPQASAKAAAPKTPAKPRIKTGSNAN
ncbi:hypothetical protein [Bradyrhizobium sp. dw_78]|uniref:hypothetical protein n=1 Tax=Bradyrhizobium sp. dw_78 TaxID=2719793 RepID=UPI001BD64708|nr:hypothetical protein [Bradyrhizobium sp. dw_78]